VSPQVPVVHRLEAAPRTVRWGHFDSELPPALRIASGDTIATRAVTHRAGDAPELMMDAAIRRIFQGVPASERGPGGHVLTGPIHVEGAAAGDTVRVEILELTLPFAVGSNVAAPWGALADDHPVGAERVVRYELDVAAGVARAPSGIEVELRPHLGIVGLAPAVPGRVGSTVPGRHGGNLDNRRLGVGSSVYLPVSHPGALLSLGDPHAAQGDGEISGTAVEASLDVVVRVNVLQDVELRGPVVETAAAVIVHGFGATLDEAMRDAAYGCIDLIAARRDCSRADAYSLASAGVDFGITQVVNRAVGVHAAIPTRVLRTIA
jgi:acetamidase/formamidase